MPPKLWRPPGLLAGFHADVDDADIGLIHAGENWAGSGLFVAAHTHAGWELYVQAHGTTRWRVRQRVHELRRDDALAVPPGADHAMLERARSRHHFFYAAVDLDAVARRHPDVGAHWTGSTPLLARSATSLLLPFRHLVRELGNSQPLQRAGLCAAVDALVVEATRTLALDGRQRSSVPAMHPAVAEARRLLDEQPDRRWSAAQLAAAVGISPTHLVELFSRDVGMPPHRYLVERRVERAAELLTGTDLSVARIATDLGFASGSHLARAVREAFQMTPTQVRRRAGAPESARADVTPRPRVVSES